MKLIPANTPIKCKCGGIKATEEEAKLPRIAHEVRRLGKCSCKKK